VVTIGKENIMRTFAAFEPASSILVVVSVTVAVVIGLAYLGSNTNNLTNDIERAKAQREFIQMSNPDIGAGLNSTKVRGEHVFCSPFSLLYYKRLNLARSVSSVDSGENE
jgi:hypothetical protein